MRSTKLKSQTGIAKKHKLRWLKNAANLGNYHYKTFLFVEWFANKHSLSQNLLRLSQWHLACRKPCLCPQQNQKIKFKTRNFGCVHHVAFWRIHHENWIEWRLQWRLRLPCVLASTVLTRSSSETETADVEVINVTAHTQRVEFTRCATTKPLSTAEASNVLAHLVLPN